MTEAELTQVVVSCVQTHKGEAITHRLKVPSTESAQQEFMRDIVLNDISESPSLLGVGCCAKGAPHFRGAVPIVTTLRDRPSFPRRP